ncbi:MAG: hypothetical protein WD398_05540 [Cyclobacteriaceae bacterium]
MKNVMIYVFGKPSSGKTLLSDKIEQSFILNEGFNSIPVNDSNLDKVISSLDKYNNTLLIIQSNLLNKYHLKALRKFIEHPDFNRGVVIQSEFKPDVEVGKCCDQVFETGYPHFDWVTKVDEYEWKAKPLGSEEIWTSSGREQAIEFARAGYKSKNKDH